MIYDLRTVKLYDNVNDDDNRFENSETKFAGLRNLNDYLSTDFTELKQITHYYARVSHPGCFLFRTQNPQKTQKANC